MNKEIFIVYFTHPYVDQDIPLPEGLPEWIKLY
jgi:hypothetical protein